MKPDDNGLLVKVKARVVRQTLFGREHDAQISRKNPVLLLRMQEIDGRKVDNIRVYINMNSTIARLHLKEGDSITFMGYARSGINGYHFIRPHQFEVQPLERPENGQKVAGVLQPGQSLRDYVHGKEPIVSAVQSKTDLGW